MGRWSYCTSGEARLVSAADASEVHIEHGPHTLTQAWLLTGWLAFQLGWEPRGGRVLHGPEVSLAFEWPHGGPRARPMAETVL